jgi:hypothetical protein
VEELVPDVGASMGLHEKARVLGARNMASRIICLSICLLLSSIIYNIEIKYSKPWSRK